MRKSALAILALFALGAGTANAATGTTTYSGTLTVKISVKVKSSPLPNSKFLCHASVNVYGGSGSSSASASILGTLSKGVMTCSVDLPYSWDLSEGASATGNWGVTESTGTMEAGPNRYISNGLSGFSPAKNGSTTISVSGTM